MGQGEGRGEKTGLFPGPRIPATGESYRTFLLATIPPDQIPRLVALRFGGRERVNR